MTNIGGDTITLYAIYAREIYINNNEILFDGTNKFDGKNYIDTGIRLFNQKNMYRNFEVSFEIKNRTSTTGKATMMSAMDERGEPWPGIVYRVSNATNDQLGANATASEKFEKNYKVNDTQKVTLKRFNGVLYVNFNDGTDNRILNFSLLKTPFDVPVTFGASLNGNLQPQRNFKGTLSNLKVILTDAEGGSVRFDANGGEEKMDLQTIAPESTVKLTKNIYTRRGYDFAGWNTKADGTGESYEDQEQVTCIGNSNEKTVTLYAFYEKFRYENEEDIVFDGKNCINTDIYLFSKKNVNKDFEISFEIKDYTYKSDQNTLFNAMDEKGNPYPGFVFRFNKANQYEIVANVGSTKGSDTYTLDTTTQVTIKRLNKILYVSINNEAEKQIVDFTTFPNPIYVPLTIGASLNGSLKPQRYFTGTLSNIKVTLSE